jgi:phytanoyl-CoA hydroxylase
MRYLGSIRKQLDEVGYVLVPRLLEPEEDLQPVVDEYSGVIDALAEKWLADGSLSSYERGTPFLERLLAIQRQVHGRYQGYIDISLNPFLTDPPRFHSDSPMHHGPAVFDLLRNPRLLDAVEALIGREIYCAPIQHVRLKPPERTLPPGALTALTGQSFWHQDQGVLTPEADETDMVGAFVAVTDVTPRNGCLLVVPGSHRHGLVHHCRTPTRNGIPDDALPGEAVSISMKAGDVLFLHKLTMHGSLPNRSESVRWSFDLRYAPIGQPTGRAFFPGFVARSQARPDTVLTDAAVWAKSWQDARERLASSPMPRYTRWNPDDRPECPECTAKAGA